MVLQIVGVEDQDFTLDNGYSFKGKKVHCIDHDTTGEKLTGRKVMDFKIDVEHKLYEVPLEIGEKYNVYFTKKGQVDFLAKVN